VPLNVEKVLDRLGISYQKSGPHLVARCPYHDDHSPSWSIRRDGDKRGLHHCKACKEGGDLVDLVMQVRDFGLRETARQWLEREEFSEKDVEVPAAIRMKIVGEKKAFKMPVGVVQDRPLSEWPGPARKELERRGIGEHQAAQWSLGYATEGRLAGRVVVPVYDRSGRLASYMARSFGSAARRYLYPSEDEGPDMTVLFGEECWPEFHPGAFTVVVTEGAFKMMAVERACKGSVVQAALGGSPWPVPAATVAKLCAFGRVVVFTDNDAAGDRCGDALEEALRGHTGVSRLKLGPDMDQDSVAPEVLRELLGDLARPVWGLSGISR